MIGAPNPSGGVRAQRIHQALQELKPTHCELIDDSARHAGHAGAADVRGETHFNLKIVSARFEGLNRVKRHQLVYALLRSELENGLHALALTTLTPGEFEKA
ncbi:unnamed protein product [Sphagnum balticum]